VEQEARRSLEHNSKDQKIMSATTGLNQQVLTAPTTFTATLTAYSFFDFEKPNGVNVDGGVRFFLDWDPMPEGGWRHYIQLAMDYATLGEVDGVKAIGSYLAIYDSKINQDFVKYGCVGPWAGSIAFGADAIIPKVQFSVHDLPWMEQSIDLWSNKTGIRLNGKALAADRLVFQRDDNIVSAWGLLHQGSGIYDFRYGMEPKAGSYDFVICNQNGKQASSPENPGDVIFRLKPDGTFENKTIADLQQRVANLEARIKSMPK
jgi:hypothetical protein